ncbi:MAG: hypothetical protein JXR66_06315 [Bacteroidales bacterium]|nr:hypothetical protein [Bacteroidales bacterium]
MKRKIVAGIILAFLALPVFSQEMILPELKGFKKLSNYPVFVPDNLWDFINGAADTYLALGFVDLHVAEYKKGKEVIKLEVYRHSDHINAFGIYASERSPSYDYFNIGSQGYRVEGVINFFTGNYYVKLRTYSEKPKTIQALETLAKRVETMLEGEKKMPEILSLFPDEGKKPDEETYVNESVLGYSYLNRAFKANYQSGNDNFSIYIIKSPSAELTLNSAKRYLSSANMEATEGESRYVVADGYNGTVFLAWNGDLMVLITGLAKDQADIADKYTSLILR